MAAFFNIASFAKRAVFLGACGAIAGCMVITEINDDLIPEDSTSSSANAASSSSSAVSSSSSSASSSGMGGLGGLGGMGGAVEMGGMGGEGGGGCVADTDCPGVTNECGKPRCFIDGLCGIDNEPIGAPCTENGGHACDGKGICVDCTANIHCASGKCGMDRVCIPPTCNDQIKNGDESDIDCGGSCPARCGPLGSCLIDADCVGGSCVTDICIPTCTDSILNGLETDSDCGGSDCPTCDLGKKCVFGEDCGSTLCENNICVPVPTCTDTTQNGAETDIDCGGPDCATCADGLLCLMGDDCTNQACIMGICTPPACNDGVQNGGEVGPDCGAVCPTGCPTGFSCTVAEDCASKKCEGPAGNTVCGEASCFDGIWNGDEAYYDCGGSCTYKCPAFYPCFVDSDCRGGLCDPMMQICMPTCTDGYTNQGESDPDCGGPCPTKCPEGWHCYIDDDCVSGLTCFQGHCLP